MQVTVFGASGKIGSLVVDDLLTGGHHVTAYVRDPGKLNISHPNLATVLGELSDPDRTRRAIRGAGAVISALGPSLKRGATVFRSPKGRRKHRGSDERRGRPSLHRPRDPIRP